MVVATIKYVRDALHFCEMWVVGHGWTWARVLCPKKEVGNTGLNAPMGTAEGQDGGFGIAARAGMTF
jgi:hypothetical protein